MSLRRVRSWFLLAAVALVASGSVVASSSAGAAAAPSAAQPATCLRPGFEDHHEYGQLTGDVGLRAGVNLACPVNGDGYFGDHVALYCARYNENTWWVLVIDSWVGYSVSGWVPIHWIDNGNPYVSKCYGQE